MALTQERFSGKLRPYDPETAHYLYRHPEDAEVVDQVTDALIQAAASFPVSVELLQDPEDSFPTLAVDIVAGDDEEMARSVIVEFRRMHPDAAPSGARLCYGVVRI